MVKEKELFLSISDLKDLLKWKSGKGILSIYVDVKDRGKTAHQRWKTTIKSGLNKLMDRYPDNEHLKSAAEKAYNELVNFPQEMKKRSLVYFHDTESGKTFWRSIQLPMENDFVWMNTAFLRPLLAMIDEAPIMGIVILSQELARVMTWRQGLINEKEELQIEIKTYLENEPTTGAGVGQLSGSTMDRFKHKVEVQVNKRLEGVAEEMAKLAKDQNWEKIILVGPPKFTDVVEEHLPNSLKNRVVGIIDKNYINASISKIEEITTELLHNWKRNLETNQVKDLLNTAAAGGRAYTGVQKSIDALIQARVEHLYFNADLHISGYRDTDGSYYVDLSEEEAEGMETEPHIIERMVELAFETNAKVTPLEGESANILREKGGVGVVLRY